MNKVWILYHTPRLLIEEVGMGEYGQIIHLQNDDDKVYPLEGKKTGQV